MRNLGWSSPAVACASVVALGFIAVGCGGDRKMLVNGAQGPTEPFGSPGSGIQIPAPPVSGGGQSGGGPIEVPITSGTQAAFTLGALTLHSNARDNVLATQTTSDGEVVAWIGSRDSAGLPVSLLAMRKYAPQTPTVADTVLYGASGLPTLVALRDGRTVTLSTNNTTATLAINLPGGTSVTTTFPITSVPNPGPITGEPGIPLTNEEALLVIQVAVLESVSDGAGGQQLVAVPDSRIQEVFVQPSGSASSSAAQGLFLGTPVPGQPGVYLMTIPASGQPNITGDQVPLYINRLAQLLTSACAASKNAGANGTDFVGLAQQAAAAATINGAALDGSLSAALRQTLVDAGALVDAPCRETGAADFDPNAADAVSQVQQALQADFVGSIDTFDARREQIAYTATVMATTADGVPLVTSTSSTFQSLTPVVVPAGGTPSVIEVPTIQVILPSTFAVAPAFQGVPVGQTVQLVALDAQGNPIDPSTLTFTSSSPNVSVSPTGVVTAVSPGTAVVNVAGASQSGAMTIQVLGADSTAASF